MRRRRYFVLLAAALMAAATIAIASPAGAISNTCTESMNPAGQGQSSGLTVACTFASGTAAGTNLTVTDAFDPTTKTGGIWHYGEARNVAVTVKRTGASPGTTAGQTTISTCATNNLTTQPITAACPTPGDPAGNLAITAADINHSVEFATSSATFTGIFITPGTFIKAVTGTTVTLSKATLAGGPLCPTSAATCTISKPANVLVSNGTNRAVSDGATTSGSATVTSATAHFLAGDVGARMSGGDLPDGATIATINSVSSVTLACVGCTAGFAGVSTATGIPLTIDPATPPTSARYVTDGSSGANKILSSATAEFANTDVGMPVVFSPAIAAEKGARIASVATNGATATLTAPANLTAGAKQFTIGLATKTAPANGDVVGHLAVELSVDPTLSPTSPPCSAGKVSAFDIPLQWENPGSYNLTSNGTTQFQGAVVSPTSIGQVIFRTSATSFGGFVKQNVTVASGLPTTAGYIFKFEFAPIAAGLCPGTGIAETLGFTGLSLKQAQNPTNTGGGGGGTRGLAPLADGTSVTYTGATGVNVTTSGGTPTNNNTCTVTSPNVQQIGC
jgi:hypothetical protein